MKIETPFGPQTISSDDIIQFVNGIPGFEDKKRFKLFQEGEDADVFLMQAVDDPALTLSATDPAKLGVRYEITLDDADAASLESNTADELVVLVLLYRSNPDGPADDEDKDPRLRANLLGPIVINPARRLGLQKVLNNVEQMVTIKST